MPAIHHINLALRIRQRYILAVRKFNIALPVNRKREALHTTLANQMRLPLNANRRACASVAYTFEGKACVHCALVVRQKILQPGQFAQFVHALQGGLIIG